MHRIALMVLLVVVGLEACDRIGSTTPIKEVLAAPAAFEGKEIRLKGRVRDITKIPLIELKTYSLQDDTGVITIVTETALPAQGAELRVTGKVESAAIIGGQSIGLRVLETKRQ